MKKLGLILAAMLCLVVLIVVLLDDSDEAGQCTPLGAGGGSATAVIDGDYAYPTDKSKISTSSAFGLREGGEFHQGMDIAGPAGTPVFAFADGTVVNAQDSGVQGFGGWVVLDHNIGGKQIQTVYGHMFPGGVHVKVGDKVKRGQHIADIGSAGQSSGPHLHFEVIEGDRAAGGAKVDPQPWLDKIGTGATSQPAEKPAETDKSTTEKPESKAPSAPAGRNPNQGKDVPSGIANDVSTLDANQLDNIRAIISMGKGRKEDPKVIKAALMAAGQESGYRMLASHGVPESLSFPNDGVTPGDATSVGLFQIQTPMNGPVEKVMDRTWHIDWFYDTAKTQADTNSEPWEIAADVERPREDLRGKYQNWEAMADELLKTEGNIEPSETSADCLTDSSADAGGSGSPIPGNATEFAKAAIEAARKQIGLPYVWGGGDANGPTGGTGGTGAGFDCSGLTLYAYAQASGGKLQLPHYTGDTSNPGQMGSPDMATVPNDKIQPGDLVFFGSGGDATHVGIAISGDKMIHAPTEGQNVTEAPISDGGSLIGVRRPKNFDK